MIYFQCVARMFSMYWRSNEESVQGDRPLKAPVLESRETVVERNSRAESVKGTSLMDSFVLLANNIFYDNAASSTTSIYATSLLYLVVLSSTITKFFSR